MIQTEAKPTMAAKNLTRMMSCLSIGKDAIQYSVLVSLSCPTSKAPTPAANRPGSPEKNKFLVRSSVCEGLESDIRI